MIQPIKKAPSNSLLLKLTLGLACFSCYTWILADSATSFGYDKGYEAGIKKGMFVQSFQNGIDCQNAKETLDSVQSAIDSISITSAIIRIPYDSVTETVRVEKYHYKND